MSMANATVHGREILLETHEAFDAMTPEEQGANFQEAMAELCNGENSCSQGGNNAIHHI